MMIFIHIIYKNKSQLLDYTNLRYGFIYKIYTITNLNHTSFLSQVLFS